MSYIIAVNPQMLVAAGMPFEAALTATCIGAAIMTIAMGLIANRPVRVWRLAWALTPSSRYTLCLGGVNVDWRVAMAIVMLEGVVIFILVACGLRKAVMDAIPASLRHAIGIGIGLFIAFIGLKGGGVIVSSESTLLTLGDLSSPVAIVSIVAIAIAVILQVLNVKGGLLISIIAATIVGIPLGVTPLPTSWNFGLDFSAFAAPFQTIPGTDTMAIVQVFLQPALLLFVFSLLMSDFFDTMGTVVAVGQRGEFADKDGNVEGYSAHPHGRLRGRCGRWFLRRELYHHVRRIGFGCCSWCSYGSVQHRRGPAVRCVRVLCARDWHGVIFGYLRCACRCGLPHAF